MDVEAIRAMRIDPILQSYGKRETILYALGLGYGADPLDAAELPFVYEADLKIVPSYVNLLCHPGFWAQDPVYGIDWVKILHAEQDFVIHAPLPSTGALRGEYRVRAVEDKGEERGALLHQDKALFDAETGTHVATVRSTLFLRGNGGEGGFGDAPAAALALPDRKPDRSIEIPTLPRQALIYRLSGDWNPLHADPALALRAGFPAPILHGLCTNGIACRALLAAYCDNEPTRLKSMFTRFSRPVLPGETIRVDVFEEGEGVLRFRAVAVERDETVLDRCSASVT
ncbi:3-alpha,7-alpha,12-alpha-trihydroxy-5-beta-cholest-24-enoyl-CoA hydratase [Brevundimonas sp. AAP58]|uniref:MaoC family dehydratase n=1 Tax=Brevundimonas sp. AAP58 TaxID=1523422 RepID=UPI0006B8846E|nr:MaoC family dehydratase [Brevundimonas sp. AAP58]KPF81129.1 3-alpha,7-alpha,12-alpha-trihydroxy-5-beta-cholest-24-enoyl-CoA hydratase [Brevundimonas sp. AAP58]